MLRLFILVGAIFVVSLLATLVVQRAGTGPGDVPNVARTRLDDAQFELGRRSLRYRVQGPTWDSATPATGWFVCRQRPAPGTLARVVTLDVRRSCRLAGPTPAPDVVGIPVHAAEAFLRGLGFAVHETSVDDRVVIAPGRRVCAELPPAGALTTSVTLRVAVTCGRATLNR